MEKIAIIIDHMALLKPISKFKREETAKRIKEVEESLKKYEPLDKIK